MWFKRSMKRQTYLSYYIGYVFIVVVILTVVYNTNLHRGNKGKSENEQKNIKHLDLLNGGHQKTCTDLHLVMLVTSFPPLLDRRNIIRSTWGSDTLKLTYRDKGIKYELFFLLGIPKEYYDVIEESKKYGDIIQFNIDESFYNLTSKLMYGIKWIHHNCQFKYLLKCDDDVSVNIPASINFILDYNTPSTKLYAGFAVLNAKPFREDRSKSAQYSRYVISKEEYPIDIYPPYCAGGGFFLTQDVIKAMVPFFFQFEPLKIDDVYIGILIAKTGIKVDMLLERSLVALFWMYAGDDGPQCRYNATNIIKHKVRTVECMERLYKFSIGEL